MNNVSALNLSYDYLRVAIGTQRHFVCFVSPCHSNDKGFVFRLIIQERGL